MRQVRLSFCALTIGLRAVVNVLCLFSSFDLEPATSGLTLATATDIPAVFDVTSVWEDFEIACKPLASTSIFVIVPSGSENGVDVIDSVIGCSSDFIQVDEGISKVKDEEAEGGPVLNEFSAPIESGEERAEGSDVCRDCKVSVANHSTVTTNMLAALRVSTSYYLLESRLKEAEENKKINTSTHEVALNEADNDDEGEVECILFEEDVSRSLAAVMCRVSCSFIGVGLVINLGYDFLRGAHHGARSRS